MSFTLHPRLAADTHPVCRLSLCEVRLMEDVRFPWLILVPMQENVREIFELAEAEQQQLMREISFVSRAFQLLTRAQKINVAALGNVVPQLHIHIIARFESDAAWPKPVWSTGGVPTPYGADARAAIISSLITNITKM